MALRGAVRVVNSLPYQCRKVRDQRIAGPEARTIEVLVETREEARCWFAHKCGPAEAAIGGQSSHGGAHAAGHSPARSGNPVRCQKVLEHGAAILPDVHQHGATACGIQHILRKVAHRPWITACHGPRQVSAHRGAQR
eukprot:7387684-Prymnesium_polylepis.1